MTAIKVERVEHPVTITLPETKARELKALLMDQISWENDEFGKTAEAIYDALSEAGISEAGF